MAYNPNLYLPAQQPYNPSPTWTVNPMATPNTNQPVNGLVSVTGIEGAKAFQLPPNSSMPLFDGNEDILYVKTTDGGGFPTIKKYRFEPIDSDISPNPAGDYVSRAEFEALENRINQMQSSRQRSRKKGGYDAEQPVSAAE